MGKSLSQFVWDVVGNALFVLLLMTPSPPLWARVPRGLGGYPPLWGLLDILTKQEVNKPISMKLHAVVRPAMNGEVCLINITWPLVVLGAYLLLLSMLVVGCALDTGVAGTWRCVRRVTREVVGGG
jgi:hypothetical protein